MVTVPRKRQAGARKQGMQPWRQSQRRRGDRAGRSHSITVREPGCPPEAGEGKGHALLLNSQEECRAHPWVRNLGLQTVREPRCVVLSHSVCHNLLQPHRGTPIPRLRIYPRQALSLDVRADKVQ